MIEIKSLPLSILGFVLVLLAQTSYAQCILQTARMAPSGGTSFGSSVALNADGTIGAIGSVGENASAGAVYIAARVGSSWSLPGLRVAPSGGVGAGLFGSSLAMNADGDTLVVGALLDDADKGAAYIFVRVNGSWVQQGPKLIPPGPPVRGYFGRAVAVSADGNTAVISEPYRGTNNDGVVHVATRSSGVWTIQSPPLTPLSGGGAFGSSVAISGDGNTVIVGAFEDAFGVGTAYVFVRNGNSWTRQGGKLAFSGATGNPLYIGSAVGLSHDGNTAVIGAMRGSSSGGGAYIFARSPGGVWSQSVPMLVPPHQSRDFGNAVSMNAAGTRCLIGARAEDVASTSEQGTAYVYARNGTSWVVREPILRPIGAVGWDHQHFGGSLALARNGEIALVGALDEQANDVAYQGAAYAFALGNGVAAVSQPTDASVVVGTTATFTAEAISALPLSYRWQRHGVDLSDGATGTGSVIAGSATSSLSVLSTTESDNGAAYQCIVDDGCASPLHMAPVGLAVTGPPGPCTGQTPTISLQPMDMSVLSGDVIAFSVVTTNPPAGGQVTYRWLRGGVPLFDGGRIHGADSPTLIITPGLQADNGSVFDCIIANECGSIRSDPVGLAVTPDCPGDFNGDGGIDGTDVSDFFDHWENGC
ncbi:MAG: hypothetical protein JSR77_18650 [Planctomycetes bacterium]|nr:hypothetical protein [Planctomycetota bacterium]